MGDLAHGGIKGLPVDITGRSSPSLAAGWGCLLLYPLPAWEPIRAKVMAFPSLDRQSNLWKRLLVGFAEEVEPDSAGRLLVSPVLRDYAHITRQVMFVGQGSHFEIWDLDAWKTGVESIRSGGAPNLPPGMENFSL